MDADFNMGSGRTTAPHPLRIWENDGRDDDDDCVILEVYDLMQISYAYSLEQASANPGAQVLEECRWRHRKPWQQRPSSGAPREPPPPMPAPTLYQLKYTGKSEVKFRQGRKRD
jgi:hypothetical protein